MPSHAPATSAPTHVPARRRNPTSRVAKYTVKRLLEASFTLPRLQEHGFTHPQNGRWLMLPLEFDTLLAHETKAVAQVVLAIMRYTIGVPGDGPYHRGLWAQLSSYDLASTGQMSESAATRGLKAALSKGYLKRRRATPGTRWEYSVNWRGIEE
jgi:hypothetical protein